MRDILFRGKGNKKWNDGDWYFGVPIKDYEGDWQICTNNSKRVVASETIGQFTGLTDKNGKKIFEGDICRFTYFKSCYVGTTAFHHSACAFGMRQDVIVGIFGKEKATRYYNLNHIDNIEVIGNIYDNPELLTDKQEANND